MDFINVALAQEVASTAAKQSGGWTGLLPLVLIMVVFYFLIIRPQQKKMKDHQSMVKNIKKGDKVVTAGGIFAKVVKVDTVSNFTILEIAEKVEIKVRPDMISEVLSDAPIQTAKA